MGWRVRRTETIAYPQQGGGIQRAEQRCSSLSRHEKKESKQRLFAAICTGACKLTSKRLACQGDHRKHWRVSDDPHDAAFLSLVTVTSPESPESSETLQVMSRFFCLSVYIYKVTLPCLLGHWLVPLLFTSIPQWMQPPVMQTVPADAHTRGLSKGSCPLVHVFTFIFIQMCLMRTKNCHHSANLNLIKINTKFSYCSMSARNLHTFFTKP